MGYTIGHRDLSLVPLAKSLFAEVLGTAILVLVGCGAALNWKTSFDVTQVSLAFGLAVTAMVAVTGHVSGGHLNPAVSVGLLAGGELSLIKCGLYIVSQCVGAILGAGVLYGVTPEGRRGNLAANGLGEGADAVHPAAALLLEAMLSMMLVLVVYATAVDSANKVSPGLAPLLIGLTVTAAHLVCIPYTGTSINPARSLGPLVVTGTFDINHWVFWVGPLVGGVLGGILYNFVLRNNRQFYAVSTNGGVEADKSALY